MLHANLIIPHLAVHAYLDILNKIQINVLDATLPVLPVNNQTQIFVNLALSSTLLMIKEYVKNVL